MPSSLHRPIAIQNTNNNSKHNLLRVVAFCNLMQINDRISRRQQKFSIKTGSHCYRTLCCFFFCFNSVLSVFYTLFLILFSALFSYLIVVVWSHIGWPCAQFCVIAVLCMMPYLYRPNPHPPYPTYLNDDFTWDSLTDRLSI